MSKVTKVQYAEYLSTALGITKSEAEKAVNAFVDFTISSLECGNQIELRGLLSAKVVTKPGRQVRNPRTGETFFAPAKAKAAIRLSKDLQTQIALTTPV